MNVFKALYNGFRFSLKDIKTISFVFFATLFLGLSAIIPFYLTAKSVAGNSMQFQSLVNGFNFTSVNEFLNNDGSAILNYLSKQFIWLGIFYFIFTIFFAGGIVKQLSTEKDRYKVKTLLIGFSEFFTRFLRLALITFFVQFVLAVGIYAVTGLILYLSGAENEKSYFYSFLAAGIIHAIIFLFISIVSDNAKFVLAFDNSRNALRSFITAIKFSTRKFFSLFPLYFIILLILGIIVYLYLLISGVIPNNTFLGILILFLLQQIFIWLRLAVKFWMLASHYQYYKPKHVTGVPIEEQKAQELQKIKEEIKVENPYEGNGDIP